MTNNPFVISIHDLGRGPGEFKKYDLTIDEHESIGTEALRVAHETSIDLELTLQSVSEGVLATGIAHTEATGECSRCLEPISFDIDEDFVQLFYYEKAGHSKKAPKREGSGKSPKAKAHSGKGSDDKSRDELDEEEAFFIENERIDLDLPVRDALLLNLPVYPLCSEECLGLCPECGLKLADLPSDHAHQKTDIRWAGLEGLDFSK
jgi:uncharacterized protein